MMPGGPPSCEGGGIGHSAGDEVVTRRGRRPGAGRTETRERQHQRDPRHGASRSAIVLAVMLALGACPGLHGLPGNSPSWGHQHPRRFEGQGAHLGRIHHHRRHLDEAGTRSMPPLRGGNEASFSGLPSVVTWHSSAAVPASRACPPSSDPARRDEGRTPERSAGHGVPRGVTRAAENAGSFFVTRTGSPTRHVGGGKHGQGGGGDGEKVRASGVMDMGAYGGGRGAGGGGGEVSLA